VRIPWEKKGEKMPKLGKQSQKRNISLHILFEKLTLNGLQVGHDD